MSATNNSGTGGYIIDVPPSIPPSAEAIRDALQQMVVALTGLPGHLVRPRWQPMPPTQPSPETTWAAVGLTQTEADNFPYFAHDGVTQLPGAPGPGVDRMQRHAKMTVMVSVYGPESEHHAGILRDALYVQQNMEPLAAIQAKLYDVRDLARNVELVNQQYIDRIDVIMELRAQIDRVYPIMNLVGAKARLITDVAGETDAEVLPPP
jgi:hypothetical protein